MFNTSTFPYVSSINSPAFWAACLAVWSISWLSLLDEDRFDECLLENVGMGVLKFVWMRLVIGMRQLTLDIIKVGSISFSLIMLMIDEMPKK